MSSILFETNQQIAKITLNRPESLNSFNKEMTFSLQKRLDECAADESIRVIFITGMGKGFCAGQDLNQLSTPENGDLSKILDEQFNPIIKKIREIGKPVVCGVNGVAAGAGANIALACDITVATLSSTFIQSFSKIGLVPDSGGTFFLPRLIGWQRATALMMLAEPISAEEAMKMGMIYKAYKDRKFQSEVDKLLERLASMPGKGLALTKRALNYSQNNDLEKQLAIEEQLQALAAQTDDFKEGVNAFIEKRIPNYTGK